MLCLIRGHRFERRQGAGEYADRWFDWCVDCGRTVPASEHEGAPQREAGAESVDRGVQWR